jgi:ABC-type antimicrobial peptide transport system permease subunit
VAIGLTLGLALAFAMTWTVPPALLAGGSVRDPLTFAATAALLGAVALVASYIPAWRATRIDPLIALRSE